jgi:hypothetical protein
MKKIALVALLLVGAAALGATVLREPVAGAAGSVQSVFVSNSKTSPVAVQEVNTDASGNIKVHEQGTAPVTAADETQLLLEHHFTNTKESQTLDVSGYREIRISFSDCGVDAQGRPVYLEIYDLGPSGQRYFVDKTSVSCSSPFGRVYDVPGRQIELTVGALERPDFSIAVYGRAN